VDGPFSLGPVSCEYCHFALDESASTCTGCGNRYHRTCLEAGCITKGCRPPVPPVPPAPRPRFSPWPLLAAAVIVFVLAHLAGAALVAPLLWRIGLYLWIAAVFVHSVQASESRLGSTALAIWCLPTFYCVSICAPVTTKLELLAVRLRMACPATEAFLDLRLVAQPELGLGWMALICGVPLALLGLALDQRRTPAVLGLIFMVPLVGLVMSPVYYNTAWCRTRDEARCAKMEHWLTRELATFRTHCTPSAVPALDLATWTNMLNQGYLGALPRDINCGWGSLVHFSVDARTGTVQCSHHRAPRRIRQ
jgi:hypothetical protein